MALTSAAKMELNGIIVENEFNDVNDLIERR